jgi:transposase
MSSGIIWVGMDVHKDSIMVAVLEGYANQPQGVDRIPNDLRRLRRYFERLGKRGEVRACYEASGAGYVLHRELTAWGYGCEVVAPSMTPVRPGERRKHDRRDAQYLACQYRAGGLTTIRIPSATEERVLDLVRCRQTFQREVLRSRHYMTKFLDRRGLTYRESRHWTKKHRRWRLSAVSAVIEGWPLLHP